MFRNIKQNAGVTQIGRLVVDFFWYVDTTNIMSWLNMGLK